MYKAVVLVFHLDFKFKFPDGYCDLHFMNEKSLDLGELKKLAQYCLVSK
jgi:hypothetical protein